MEIAPFIDEVQQAIDVSWKTAGQPAGTSPCVLRTLLCFSSDEDLEILAVIDSDYGGLVRIADWTVSTVGPNAPSFKPLTECRIGDTIGVGDDRFLVLVRNGGPVPKSTGIDAAVLIRERVLNHSRRLTTELRELAHLLSRQRNRLEEDRLGFIRFGELTKAVEIVETEILGTQFFESRLDQLRALPDRRTIETLDADIAREANLLHELREDIEESISRQAETLATHRNRYDDLEGRRQRDESFIRKQRAMIEDRYHETMRMAPAIGHADAVAEMRDIGKVADIEGSDRFVLRRRLYILRLRCRQSMAIGDNTVRTILTDIEEEIHRLSR